MFSENCAEYYDKDLVVIPLNGKIPVIKNWSKFAKVAPSELLISSWEKKYKKNNMGLMLGELTGVVAVDIDKDEAKELVPKSPVVKKGQKGETRFFKYNGEVNFKRHDIGVEMLSAGNQTVIPPSVHPETHEPYVWSSRETLLSIDIEDLPTLPEEFFKKVQSIAPTKEASGGRHNRLIEVCGAMLGRGEDFGHIVDELLKYDEENHDPPYFTDKSEAHKGRGYSAAMKMVTSVADTIERKGGDITPQKVEIVMGEEEVQKKIDSQEKKNKISFPSPPKGSMLEQFAGYCLAKSYKRRPKFALASAVSLIGTLASNKVRYKDSTPNCYQLLVADSGEGKDVPLTMPKKTLTHEGLLGLVGLGNYRGDKSVVKKFETQRERIDTIDEISKLFRSINSTNIFSSNIAEVLTELWNSSNDLYAGFTTSQETSGIVYNPCLNLLSATTPDAFSNTFSSQNLMQGFGARFLYIFEEGRINLQEPPEIDMSKEMRDWLYYWAQMEPKMEKVDVSKSEIFQIDLKDPNAKPQVLKNIDRPMPKNLKASESAQKRLKEIMHYFDELSYHCDIQTRPIVLRAYQQVQKIMLVSAVSRCEVGNEYPYIESVDVEFAFHYVEACIKMTTSFFEENLIESRHHRDSQKVLRVLKNAGKLGISKNHLTKALWRNFKSKELYDRNSGILPSLIEAQKILCVKKEGKIRFYYNFESEVSEDSKD